MKAIRLARERANRVLIRSGFPAWRDRRLVRRLAQTRNAVRDKTQHLLVSAPGAGNIGDQALFEAFVENKSGPLVVITRSSDDVYVPEEQRHRVKIVALDALLYGRGKRHRRDLVAFGELLPTASTLSVIGADVMDGKYSPRAASNRWNLARIAAEQKVPARIVGFSWNGVPTESAKRSLIAAATAGVSLLIRDPVSSSRVRALGVPAIDTADIVFAASTLSPVPTLDSFCAQPYAIVNVSALVAHGVDQHHEVLEIVRFLIAQGLRVLLLPHVSRPGSDDIPLGRDVVNSVNDPQVHAVDELLEPSQVRSLASRATIVVTGRMHLAVMSLWSGTPAVTLSTQGKVAGLMQLVNAPELCVEPLPGFGSRIIQVLEEALPMGSPIRQRIEESREHVKRLAQLNTAPILDEDATTRVSSDKGATNAS